MGLLVGLQVPKLCQAGFIELNYDSANLWKH